MDNTSHPEFCSPGGISYSCYDSDLNPDNVTAARWQTSDRESGLGTGVILLLYMLVGVPFNMLVIVKMLWKRLYRQPAHVLMLNLAVSDLLMCVLYLPINITSALAGEFIFGSNDVMRCHVCQIGVIFVVFTHFNVHVLALMSVDRFLYFRLPLRYNKLVTTRRTVLVTALLWVYCVLLSIPLLLKFGEIRFTQSVSTCTLYLLDRTDLTYNIYYEVFSIVESLVLPIPVLVITTVGVVTIVWTHLKKTYGVARELGLAQEEENEVNRRRNSKQLQLAKLYGAVLISNLVTWTPNILNITVLLALCKKPFVIPHGFFVSNYLFFLSGVWLHPVIQVCMIPEIRHSVILCSSRKVLLCCSRMGRSVATNVTNMTSPPPATNMTSPPATNTTSPPPATNTTSPPPATNITSPPATSVTSLAH